MWLPSRSKQRRILIRKCAAVTLALSLATGCRWFVATRNPVYPAEQGVYAEEITAKPGEIQLPNAATFYAEGLERLDLATIYPNGDYRALRLQAPAVERAKPVLELLREGMKYPYSRRSRANLLIEEAEQDAPDFMRPREAARLFAIEADVRAAQGDHAGAIASSLDAVRLGTDVAKGHSLMEGMVGLLLQCFGENAGVDHVSRLSATEARTTASRLEATLATAPTIAEIITQERDRGYRTLQRVFRNKSIEQRDNAEREADPSLQGSRGYITYNWLLFRNTKQGIADEYSAYMDQVLTRARMPYYQAKQLPRLPRPVNPLVPSACEDYARPLAHYALITTRERVLLARLAVHAYRKEHNNMLPDSLEELTAGTNPYLTHVPEDLFSKSGKEPLCYDARIGEVYSVGENGVDDGYSQDDDRDAKHSKDTRQI